MAGRWIRIGLIVIVASGCDNVAWGGMTFQLTPPAGPHGATETSTAEAGIAAEVLGLDPLLFLVRRNGAGAALVPVGHLTGDSLSALPASDRSDFNEQIAQRWMSPGDRFTLFHWGSRVGTFTAGEDWELDDAYCLVRPSRSGRVELLPEAADAQLFLALPEGAGGERPLGQYVPLSSTLQQRTGSVNVATQLISRLGAPWPPSVLEMRRDLQIVPLPGGSEPGLSGSFLHADDLTIASPGANAYSLFYLARPQPDAFQAEYAWFHRSSSGQKAAPRTVNRLEWGQGDDAREHWVLEVFGDGTRWLAGIQVQDGRWSPGFQDPCAQVPTGENALQAP